MASIVILLVSFHGLQAASLPDLTPLERIQNVFRGSKGVCKEEKVLIVPPALCSALPIPSQERPHIIQLAKIPGIVWGVRNTGASGFSSDNPVKARLKANAATVQEVTITNMAQNETRTFTYERPENRRRLIRDISCKVCYDLDAAPFNWSEPENYAVEVDLPGVLVEANENNNVKTYLRSDEVLPNTATIAQ